MDRQKQKYTQHRIDTAAIKGAVSLLSTAQRYGLKLRRAGREHVALSPFKAEKTPSFYIDDRKGLFNDFASGEGGDVIRFVQLMEGCDFREAVAKLIGEAGLADPDVRVRRAVDYEAKAKSAEELAAVVQARNIGFAALTWKKSYPAPGTVVETYLASRGIDMDALEAVYGWRVPPTLRFHPELHQKRHGEIHIGPAMVGIVDRIVRGTRQFCGIHRTWLAADGTGKAAIPQNKMTLGQIMGTGTRLSPVGPVAVLGEGYETTLSVMAELARHGEVVFGLCGLFLGNITGMGIRTEEPGVSIVPDERRPGLMLPEGVEEVILLKDADGKNPADIDRFMRRAATKFQRAGLRVRVASPELGMDFNDMVREEIAA